MRGSRRDWRGPPCWVAHTSGKVIARGEGGGGAAGRRHRSDSGSKQDSAATLVHIYHRFSKQLKPHLTEGHFCCAVI